MLEIEVVTQAVPGMRGPRASEKRSGALRYALWKTDAKDLWDVYCLTDRQLVPVNLRLLPMNTPSMHRHLSHGKFYSAVWAGDLPSQPISVRRPSARSLLSH